MSLSLTVSRSGLDKSLPKKGAGAGNWGSITQETERYLHSPDTMGEIQRDTDNVDVNVKKTAPQPKPRRMSSMSDEERKDAATFRKGAMGRQDR